MTGIDEGTATVSNDGGRRFLRFPHLDVAILNGVVYTTTGGLIPLGPLADASASRWRLPPDDDGPAGTVTARTMIVVVSGAGSHRLTVEHTPSGWASRQMDKQVAQFNLLATRARPTAIGGCPEPVLSLPAVGADVG